MQRKGLHVRDVELKAAKGTVEAIFSRFDQLDHDGDVTLRSAFTNGAPVVISAFNHGSWEGAMPVGKGRVDVRANEAVMVGQFFVNTNHGRDAFETVKALAEDGLGEWSYGFTIDDFEHGEFRGKRARYLKALTVHEVSPVLRGAGVGTRTLSVDGDYSRRELRAIHRDLVARKSLEAEFLRSIRSSVEEWGS